MWKLLALNTLVLTLIFLTTFSANVRVRRTVLVVMLGCAVYFALRTGTDPFVWGYYVLYVLTAFWCARQFRRWALARAAAFDEEHELLSSRLERDRSILARRTKESDALARKASEILYAYDKIKEMSRSLDTLETLLIYAEALRRDEDFEEIKLCVFADEAADGRQSQEVYAVRGEDVGVSFDRGAYLSKPERSRTTLFPSDQALIARVLESGETAEVRAHRRRSAALPVLVQERIVGVLVLHGAPADPGPLAEVLTDRFLSEMQRVKLYERVETLAITDGLTGVYVRRHLMERLEGEVERCRRFGLKLSFLMIDIDHFKRFNDERGHLVGDAVLKQVASTIRRNVREVDLVGRYGGEEFGVLLVETDESSAFLIAERIRRSIAEAVFRVYDERLAVHVSIGCATLSKTVSEPNLLVEAADSALYQAKRQGRNRVCLSSLPDLA
ncbi:MAG: hypothetical protein MOGMAGMI_00487 [Candidatus Omnitrophica bacterium]|nr:hypothetical protein [Candidatus Omnitrophota bacterium]